MGGGGSQPAAAGPWDLGDGDMASKNYDCGDACGGAQKNANMSPRMQCLFGSSFKNLGKRFYSYVFIIEKCCKN